jgi:hypothetical protein
MKTRRDALLWLASAAMVALGSGPVVLAGHHHDHVCCPDCGNKVCMATPTTIKDKKTAYSCECKDICIPGVKGPFAPCCEPPSCGRVRTIKVLKKTEYECARCGYKWEVKSVGCDCCK